MMDGLPVGEPLGDKDEGSGVASGIREGGDCGDGNREGDIWVVVVGLFRLNAPASQPLPVGCEGEFAAIFVGRMFCYLLVGFFV